VEGQEQREEEERRWDRRVKRKSWKISGWWWEREEIAVDEEEEEEEEEGREKSWSRKRKVRSQRGNDNESPAVAVAEAAAVVVVEKWMPALVKDKVPVSLIPRATCGNKELEEGSRSSGLRFGWIRWLWDLWYPLCLLFADNGDGDGEKWPEEREAEAEAEAEAEQGEGEGEEGEREEGRVTIRSEQDNWIQELIALNNFSSSFLALSPVTPVTGPTEAEAEAAEELSRKRYLRICLIIS
jgi:hypothetical protein